MNKKVTKFVAILVAAAMLFVIPLSACKPKSTHEPFDEGVTVVFDYNDEFSRPYTYYVQADGKVEEPDEPLREGYAFNGWWTEKVEGEEVNFPIENVTESKTYYAHWDENTYTVTLDYNYEGSTSDELSYKYGSVIEEEPEAPSRENEDPPMYFYYWQTAPDGGVEIEFPYTVEGDVTFYAVWSPNRIIKIVFNYNYEDAPADVIVRTTVGGRITTSVIKNPTRPGYTFMGWADTPDAESGKKPNFNVDESKTMYAIWEQKDVTIGFVADCLTVPYQNFTEIYAKGTETIDAPEEIPTREGYEFDGWWTARVGGTRVEFPLQVFDNARYYAHWKHDLVETNIFDAEFVEFDPLAEWPGYSGATRGAGVIVSDDTNSAHSEPYPEYRDSAGNIVTGAHYVSYMYKKGATLTFIINSDRAVDNVTLKASLGIEIIDPLNLVMSPEGDYGFSFIVNGTALNYGSITITSPGGNISTGGQTKGTFQEYTIGNISLKEGENVIQLVTNNDNKELGGTMGAVAPMVDYIKLETSATLSWRPIYDNLVLKTA